MSRESRDIVRPGQRRPRVSRGCKPEKAAPNPGRFRRRRAFSLIALQVLIAAHILHWRLAGKTLAPLEFNEATLALEDGLVTAGLIFMVLAVLVTVCFGRLFCGWGCHILALQDLCGWLLGKLGIKPKPIRSRLLFLLPLSLLFYMFLWTPFRRMVSAVSPEAAEWLGTPGPFAVRFSGGEAGLSSFVTADFWRNLPGPGIALLTFTVCGFAVVYLLGRRAFCAYVCPYGAFFSWADKFTPGKILLAGDCTACGKCSAACKSSVNVMHEVRTFGKVVDPACFKDMDCVAACPEQALSFGFAKPTVFTREKPKAKPFSFSVGEEWAMLGIFAAAMLVFLGLPEGIAPWAGRLYGLFPLFLSATLSALTAVTVIYLWRLARRREVEFQRWVLKRDSLRAPGKVFLAVTLSGLVFLAHSSLVQYHMFQAGRAIFSERRMERLPANSGASSAFSAERLESLHRAEKHLESAERLGLGYTDRRISRQKAFLALARRDFGRTQAELHRAVALEPRHPDSRFQLGWVMAAAGKAREGLAELERADSLSREEGRFQGAVLKGVLQLGYRGFWPQALDLLEEASLSRPADTLFHGKMMALLARTSEPRDILMLLERIVARNPGHGPARASLSELR